AIRPRASAGSRRLLLARRHRQVDGRRRGAGAPVVVLITRPRVVAVTERQAEQDSTPTRLPAWVVVPWGVAIAGGAAFLRLWQLNALGFSSDEAVYAGQAAAIAGDPALKGIFPVFRAHPLLSSSYSRCCSAGAAATWSRGCWPWRSAWPRSIS